MFSMFCALYYRAKNHLPRHRVVQLTVKIGKFRKFDNIFFGELHSCNILRMNELQFGPFFYLIPGHGLSKVGALNEGYRKPFSGANLE
jgi:hypothetical protein